VKPGTVLFELDGIPIEDAKKALNSASHKLPIHTRIIEQEK